MVGADQISGPVNIQKIQLKMRNRRTGSELSQLVWSIRCVIFQLAAELVGQVHATILKCLCRAQRKEVSSRRRKRAFFVL
jgi:hypothetical protein